MNLPEVEVHLLEAPPTLTTQPLAWLALAHAVRPSNKGRLVRTWDLGGAWNLAQRYSLQVLDSLGWTACLIGTSSPRLSKYEANKIIR